MNKINAKLLLNEYFYFNYDYILLDFQQEITTISLFQNL